MIVILISILLGYSFARFLKYFVNHLGKRRKYSRFPQLSTLPIIGHIRFLMKFPINHNFIPELTNYANNFINNGKLFIIWLGHKPILMIFNKNYIKLLLSKNESELLNKGNFFYKSINEYAPNSLLTINGNDWKMRRKILSQPFHTTNLDNFLKIVNEESRNLVKYFKKNECKDLMEEMQKINIQIFSRVMFDYNLNEMNELNHMVELNKNVTNILTKKIISVFLVSPFFYRFTNLATEETSTLKNITKFEDRMLGKKTGEIIENLKSKLSDKDLDSKSNNQTIIEILLKNFNNRINEKTKKWSGFNMKEIQSQLTTFIVSGFDTTSTALTFLVYHLAKYPEYQEKIYKEIELACGKDLSHELTLNKIKSCVLLNAFINESLRIQPIIPLISRYTMKDIEFDDKYTIPANTEIGIFIDKILKDPDYFPEPEKFKPERFLEEQSDNLFTHIPFSAGSRNCIAKKFALNSLSFSSANLIRAYKIQFNKNTPSKLRIKYEIVNKPIETIEIDFVERKCN